MKPSLIAKIVSIIIFGIAFGSIGHIANMRAGKMGRDAYIARRTADAGRQFDRHIANPRPLIIDGFVGIYMAGALFGAYELVGFGLSKAFRKSGHGRRSRRS